MHRTVRKGRRCSFLVLEAVNWLSAARAMVMSHKWAGRRLHISATKGGNYYIYAVETFAPRPGWAQKISTLHSRVLLRTRLMSTLDLYSSQLPRQEISTVGTHEYFRKSGEDHRLMSTTKNISNVGNHEFFWKRGRDPDS